MLQLSGKVGSDHQVFDDAISNPLGDQLLRGLLWRFCLDRTFDDCATAGRAGPDRSHQGGCSVTAQ